ncbi:MAG: pseudouridine synthase [Clostridia bacterium]
MEKIRLSKALAQSGVCSRRNADVLIEEGKVKVNGKVAIIGDKVDVSQDKIMVDNKAIRYNVGKKSYFVLNKPRGYITTMKDEMDRKNISDLIKGISSRVVYAGRLDRESEGMLFLSDDGEMINKLTHPSTHLPKTYRVTVQGLVSLEVLKSLRTGVRLDDGYVTAPAEVKVRTEKEDRTVLTLTIFEGKNRQIRRMCDALGFDVLQLKRIAIGNIRIGSLKTGQYRMLNDEEVAYLKSL